MLFIYLFERDDSKTRILRYIYSSNFLKTLPKLPIHCRENDGEFDNIPALFEDISTGKSVLLQTCNYIV